MLNLDLNTSHSPPPFLKCPDYCSACPDEYCIECEEGFYLLRDECVKECDNKVQPVNGVCVECNPNCLTCGPTGKQTKM